MRKAIFIFGGLILISGIGIVFVRGLPVQYVAEVHNETERFAAKAHSALSGVSVVLPERPDVSLTLTSIGGEGTGWQAVYTNPVDQTDDVTLSVAHNASVVAIGSEHDTRWFLMPFSVRLSSERTFSYVGLFSFSGDDDVKYHSSLLVGERVVVTALAAEEPHVALISYLTHAAGEPPALPPTVPAFVRVARSKGNVQELLRGVNTATSTVVVSVPASDQDVTSPVHVEGTISDGWFFEAQAPVRITDQAGTVLGLGVANAQGEWMTTSPVPFTANITLSIPYQGPAILTLQRDNPSGDVERDASVSIPIYISGN